MGAAATVATMAGALAACEADVVTEIGDARAAAGVGELATSEYLTARAKAHSAELCAAGAVSPTEDPDAFYGGETQLSLGELVGAAPLDPGIEDPILRNIAATDAVWAAWADDPTVVAPQWDEMGVGEAQCPDGNLYLTAVFRENPTMPAAGRYVRPQVPATSIQVTTGIVFATVVDFRGRTIDLRLDLYVPPNITTPRPMTILVHGGGFVGGSRTDRAADALAYARLGFVAATIDYRLRPGRTGEEQLPAAIDAIDDGMEAVRWAKANAATYGVDTSRIAILGTSAGGAVALGVAAAEDPTPGGPLAAFDPSVTAAVSTGAGLTAGLSLIDFGADDSPSMIIHYEQDTSAGAATYEYTYQTCEAMHAVGVECDGVKLAGSGHTVNIGPLGPFWFPEIGPFLWYHLTLDDL